MMSKEKSAKKAEKEFYFLLRMMIGLIILTILVSAGIKVVRGEQRNEGSEKTDSQTVSQKESEYDCPDDIAAVEKDTSATEFSGQKVVKVSDNTVKLVWAQDVPKQETQFPYLEDIGLSYELQKFMYQQCQIKGVDYFLALAITKAESDFDPNSIRANEDFGIMQINICNHEDYEKSHGITDWLDPEQNIVVGVDILANTYKVFDTDNDRAMGYNLGIAGAKKAKAEGIVTTYYAQRVLEYKEYYKGIFEFQSR